MLPPTLTIVPAGECEIVITRDFRAPRELVFDALTQPDLIKKWLLGPPGWAMVVCDVDLKVGGAYRYVWRRNDGFEMGMGGFNREIVRPERLVHTERFDQAWYPGEALVTTKLEEINGRTTFLTTVRYESKKARDTVLESEMEEGVAASYEKIDALLATQTKASAKS